LVFKSNSNLKTLTIHKLLLVSKDLKQQLNVKLNEKIMLQPKQIA